MTTISRRRFLSSSAALAAAASVTPVFLTRANAAPQAGELQMVAAAPNPEGAFERLFLLKGDALAQPITTIVSEEGAPMPERSLKEGERRVLRLMHFNDMHNHMTDPHGAKGDTHRLAQMVKLVKEAKASAAENEIVLFLSAGDDHTGSVFDELMGWSPEEFVADAGYRAASAAGVDLAVLGNHEFDRGAHMLKIGIDRDAAFPVLSANIHGSAHLTRDEDYVAAAIGEVKGLRIGFIGLTTAVDTRVGMEGDPTLAVASPVRAAVNVYKAVEAVSDVVVILSHCGYGRDMHASGKAATARKIGEGDFAIAEAVGPLGAKPCVLIGGHSHTTLNEDGIDADNMVAGLLLTQANANGKFLGNISMSVSAGQGRDAWFSNVSLHGIKSRDDRVKEGDEKYAGLEHDGDFDAAFEAEVMAPMFAALDGKLAEVIGEVADDSLINRERTIADRYVGEAAIANFMNDTLVARSATFPGGKVDFALFNATGLATGIDKGPLTFREWFDVMPYADVIDVATRDWRADPRHAALQRQAPAAARGSGRHRSAGLRLARLPALLFRHPLSDRSGRLGGRGPSRGHHPRMAYRWRRCWKSSSPLPSTPTSRSAPSARPGTAIRSAAASPAKSRASMSRGLPWDHTGLVYRNEIIAAIRTMGPISAETGAKLDGRVTIVA
jgi:5'-nucleotidase/UDP-sugar diphosphatase